jgi:hypothetical protein
VGSVNVHLVANRGKFAAALAASFGNGRQLVPLDVLRHVVRGIPAGIGDQVAVGVMDRDQMRPAICRAVRLPSETAINPKYYANPRRNSDRVMG